MSDITHAFMSVLAAMHLPCVMLGAVVKLHDPYDFLLIPAAILTIAQQHWSRAEQTWLAVAGNLIILAVLTWLGSKGNRALSWAVALAFLNSAFWCFIILIVV